MCSSLLSRWYHPLPTGGYEVLFLPNPLGHVVEEHRSKKARLETRAAISCKRAFVSRPPPTAHSIPVKEECFLWFYASYDSIVLLHLGHVQHVPEEGLVMTIVRKLLFVKAGFHDQVSSICLPPLSLYYRVAITFSCSAETFCRCASYWSGLLVEEPVLRLILVHLGPESLEGRKPERDYEAQVIVVVTGLPILGNSLWK